MKSMSIALSIPVRTSFMKLKADSCSIGYSSYIGIVYSKCVQAKHLILFILCNSHM